MELTLDEMKFYHFLSYQDNIDLLEKVRNVNNSDEFVSIVNEFLKEHFSDDFEIYDVKTFLVSIEKKHVPAGALILDSQKYFRSKTISKSNSINILFFVEFKKEKLELLHNKMYIKTVIKKLKNKNVIFL
jgi:hypothetical protein